MACVRRMGCNGGEALSPAQFRAGSTREKPMTSLEIILLTNAATKLITALERLVRAIRQP